MPLLDLPPELIASVTDHLFERDLFATRLAARALERASFSKFGTRFFRKKGYLLYSPSLGILRSISQHEELRKYVRHVWFNPDFFNAKTPFDDKEVHQELPHEAEFQACINDHVTLVSERAARLQEILTAVFANLPNLEVLGMRRSQDHSPWGWGRLRLHFDGIDPRNIEPRYYPRDTNPLSVTTRLLLAQVNAASAAKISLRRFYTDIVQLDNLPSSHLSHVFWDQVFGSLQSLELNLTPAHLDEEDDEPEPVPVADAVEEYGRNAAKLVQAAAPSSLQELSLHTSRPAYDWRALYPYFCMRRIVQAAEFQCLERLKLEQARLSIDSFLTFLARSKDRLRSLKLRNVRLVYSEDEIDPGRDRRIWDPIFSFLATSCPALSTLLVQRPRYYNEGGYLLFKPPAATSLGPVVAELKHPSSSEHANSDVPDLGTLLSVSQSYDTLSEEDQRELGMVLKLQGRRAVEQYLEGVMGKLVYVHSYRPPWEGEEAPEGWYTDTSDEEDGDDEDDDDVGLE
jgi:hypothetical protein